MVLATVFTLAGSGETATPPTTTIPRTTTTTTTAPERIGPRPGDSGDDVIALQRRLVDLGYWLSNNDGTYGSPSIPAFPRRMGAPA